MARYTSTKKPYGLGRFLFDLLFGIVTGGLWWLWLLFKALRNNS
jgi:hypothetical protein